MKYLLLTVKLSILQLLCFSITPVIAESRGPLPGITSSSNYLIYYGGITSQDQIDAMKVFDVVVLHPASTGVTPNVVKQLQDGGVSYVLGYISIGEDIPGPGEAAIIDQGLGPVYVDELTKELTYQQQGIASFYVDSIYNHELADYEHDAVADTNGIFGGYFISPNDKWREILNVMRIGGNPTVFEERQYVAGLQQIVGERDTLLLDSKTANFGFDGFFLDTIDTAGPYTAEGWYPWVAPEMQKTVQFISDTYPDKVVLANRGSFFFHAGLHNLIYDIKPIDFTIRPYINAVLFESYMLDSDITHTGQSPYFNDNHNNVAPKLMTEANRKDGFTITNMDYMMERPSELYDQLFNTVVKENGWLAYLTTNRSIQSIDLVFHEKLADSEIMLDTLPPQWMHTGNTYNGNKPARVGVQALKIGTNPGDLDVFWDSAKDQSWPVKYNIYIATQEDFSDEVKYASVKFDKNRAWDADPVNNVANKFTITGLLPITYYVRVRAEDSSTTNYEDTNAVTLSIDLSTDTRFVSNPVNSGEVSVDSDITEWSSLRSFGTDPLDIDITGTTVKPLDWKETWLAHDNNNLYFANSYYTPLTMSWGHIVHMDTDTNKQTGYQGTNTALPIGVDYMMQGYHLWKYSGTGNDWNWQYVGAVGRSWNQYTSELFFPRSWIGNPKLIHLYYEANNYALGHASIDLFADDAVSNSNYFIYYMD